MINVSEWMKSFLTALVQKFGERIWFVGLQGSYARGEANENSDIDVVVIFDKLSATDIKEYGDMLDSLEYRELICGFVCGRDEIFHWDASDLFQFYHDTKPIYGTLDSLLSMIDSNALDRAIKVGSCNIYHACVHNMLHEKSTEILRGLYKSASFVVQAIVFKQTDKYVSRKNDLYSVASADEKMILDAYSRLRSGDVIDFDKMSQLLFEWSGRLISRNGV